MFPVLFFLSLITIGIALVLTAIKKTRKAGLKTLIVAAVICIASLIGSIFTEDIDYDFASAPKTDGAEGESVEDEAEPEKEEEGGNGEEQQESSGVSREDVIAASIADIVDAEYNSTDVREIRVNENMADESVETYIVLVDLTWHTKNRAKQTREMLEMYSEDLAARMGETDDIAEIVVFWKVPYHIEGENAAKYTYEQAGDGMALTDAWIAPVLQE